MPSSDQNATPLSALWGADDFIRRHIGPNEADIQLMLDTVGTGTLDALMDETMPSVIRQTRPLTLGEPVSEAQVLAELADMANDNIIHHSMIGQGYHPTLTPPVIQRNVLENPGWYTAYTPYQAEIAQGRLEALLNFQQMVMDLTAMPLSNASLLDEATAAAEAMALLKRVSGPKSGAYFLIASNCFAHTIDVVQTRAKHLDIPVKVVDDLVAELQTGPHAEDCFAVLCQQLGHDGALLDLAAVTEAAHARGTKVAVATDLLALTLLKPPGEFGVDAVVGSAQRFGVPMAFGGPHAAFLATREEHRRSMPGRIIGVSKDRHGHPALRMALQTREQHIRREKAMSNICTAQALLAVMASFYGVWHGPAGLTRIARRVHRLTCLLDHAIQSSGYQTASSHYFDTITVHVDEAKRQALLHQAQEAGINLRADLPGCIGISVNEATTASHVQTLIELFCGAQAAGLDQADALLADQHSAIPAPHQRHTDFMTHEVFGRYQSETEMLRYMKRLENRDLSLAHAMIPLGSCTMKLNASAEMMPVSYPGFSQLHPFCPPEQARGYHRLIADLERMLSEITGFAGISLQPNAGSQGEYAGLLAIKGYHESRGDLHRRVCLIPASAHGTNPASAQMTGMDIVVIACDAQGNVDVADLERRIEQYRDQLAALMITYPSTHGVFEEAVVEVCEKVRAAGGQVYLDGANTNAVVGWSRVADYADVCHLNLHKTFCIPHGGGGPGIGPIGVRAHLIPFLPGHVSGRLGPKAPTQGAVAAAPWGSAGILPISWAYIRMMGDRGLVRATQLAILNANYIARRLENHYRILYTGRNGRIAHECIVDLRPFKEEAGISEEDVAKRLIDYGFHAPTMSWPVPGTLMIEPTESESKAELDRFIQAMIAIRKEITLVANGEFDAKDNPLTQAPHTSDELMADAWTHPYSRQQAGWPVRQAGRDKFFPAVARVDNVYGDRNLVCSCPPLSDWLEAS